MVVGRRHRSCIVAGTAAWPLLRLGMLLQHCHDRNTHNGNVSLRRHWHCRLLTARLRQAVPTQLPSLLLLLKLWRAG
jgi:hypothetical protein